MGLDMQMHLDSALWKSKESYISLFSPSFSSIYCESGSIYLRSVYYANFPHTIFSALRGNSDRRMANPFEKSTNYPLLSPDCQNQRLNGLNNLGRYL